MTVASAFRKCRSRNEAALIVYYTAGFPTLNASLEIISMLDRAGADMVEFGIPFSDPVADGQTIQYASHAALKQGVTLTKIMEGLAGIRLDVPVVLMSYSNPLLAYGMDRLMHDARHAGVSGLIVPDLPVEEGGLWGEKTRQAGLDLVCLAAPTSSDGRLSQIAARSRGFIYCVAVKGVTGTRRERSSEAERLVRRIRTITDMPAAVGFGVSTPEQVRHTAGFADGVIVGSRIIQSVQEKEDTHGLVQSLKKACRGVNVTENRL